MSIATATSRVRDLRDSADAKRLLAVLAAGVVLAVMVGPSGSVTAPTSGLAGTFHQARTYIIIAIFFAGWLLATAYRRYGAESAGVRTASAQVRSVLGDRRTTYGFYVVLLVVAIVVPHLVGDFWQEVLVGQIAPYVLLAVGLNVVVGFAGLLDLGYIAFYAVGAYTTAYFTGALPAQPPFHLNPFWTIPLAIIAAMLAGVILGGPTLRLRGDYLAIVTLGFGLIVSIVADNLTSVTGGSNGNVVPVKPFSIFGYTWPLELLPGHHLPWYYLILGLTVIVIVLFHFLENSRVGRTWVALREDEVAAEAVGINPLKYKVMAFAIGASTSGLAGAFFASKNNTFTPDVFSFQASVLILVFVIFGGMGSMPGVILGAAFLQYLPQALRGQSWFQQQDLYLYIGALLVVMMIFRPQGLIPSRRRAREIRLAEAGVGAADALAAPGEAP